MNRRLTPKSIDELRTRLGDRTIVIIGLMGAGKTTVGRRLAELHGRVRPAGRA